MPASVDKMMRAPCDVYFVSLFLRAAFFHREIFLLSSSCKFTLPCCVRPFAVNISSVLRLGEAETRRRPRKPTEMLCFWRSFFSMAILPGAASKDKRSKNSRSNRPSVFPYPGGGYHARGCRANVQTDEK